MALITRPWPIVRIQSAKSWAGATSGDSFLTQLLYKGHVQPIRSYNDDFTGNNELTILFEKLREIVGT